ncbi:MAG: DNA repair and recombination protein RadB [archaeon]
MKLLTKEFDAKAEAKPLSDVVGECAPTGSRNIDELLGKGIPLGLIAHVYGPPGVGKTNLCLTTAVECAKKGKKVLFVDTEGGFRVERFLQICKDADVAKRIMLKQVRDFEEQKELVRNLRRIVNKDFGLVIFDSFVSLYRLEVSGTRREILELSRELGRQLGKLSKIARDFNLAVMLSNQVYASFDEDGEKEVVPVGGDVLLYWSKLSLELEKLGPGQRKATLIKHPYAAEGKHIKFRITKNGLE